MHLIDTGIDTGPALATRSVDIADCRSIDALRGAVDRAQLALLGDVLELIAAGKMPEPLPADGPSGPQYFSMHQELADILEARLAGR